jgi:SAM-dependent methyltransferase
MRWRTRTVASIMLLVVSSSTVAQDVPFLESPESVVEAMLELAGVDAADVVYDLGSGDGRIVIAAAVKYGARGVGIEIQPELVELSSANAREAGVTDRVRFVQGDFFEADFSEATALTIYLHPKVNRRLRPLLSEQLAPGTPVVAHRFPIQGWTPVESIKVEGRYLYLYVIP